MITSSCRIKLDLKSLNDISVACFVANRDGIQLAFENMGSHAFRGCSIIDVVIR